MKQRVLYMMCISTLLCMIGITILTGCNCDDLGNLGANRELVAAPPTITFDGREGEVQIKSVRIQAKQGDIQIDEIKMLQGQKQYSLVASSIPTLPYDLKSGESLTLKIEYKGAKGFAPTGKIRILSDASIPTIGHLDISLLAKVNQQRLSFKPEPVDFGSVERGQDRVLQVTGTNQGRAKLLIESIRKDKGSSPTFSFPDGLPSTPLTVEPGKSFTFKVKYQADTNPIDRGRILFTCKDGCAPNHSEADKRKNPYPLQLIGTLGKATIEVEPTVLDYGFIANGTEATKKFRIHNRGGATLRISKIGLKRLSSGAFRFSTLLNVEIPPKQSKEVIVRFRPTTGSTHKGAIEITSNDTSKPLVTVQLKGQVTAPNIKVNPLLLAFGKAPILKKMEINISNTGNQPLIVEPATFFPGTSKEFRFDSTPTQHTIPPNSGKKIVVVYEPVDKVADNGKVLIRSNDPDQPLVEVVLRGLGLAPKICDLVPQPTQVQFGLGLLNQPTVRELKLFNAGSAPCELRELNISMKRSLFPPYIGPEVFILTNPPAACKSGTCSPPEVVQPGKSIALKLSFFPTMEKPHLGNDPAYAGTVEYTSGEAGQGSSKRLVPLSAIGTRPCISILPDTIDFGLVTKNCASRNEPVVIHNTCETPIQIKKLSFTASSVPGFKIIKAPTVPFTMQKNSSVPIEVRYNAKAPIQKESAALHIEHSFAVLSPLVVNMAGEGTNSAEQTDIFKQPPSAQADVLFVIDNSGSMVDERRAVSQNMKSFIQWAISLKADFQLGVISTQVVKGGTYLPGELRKAGGTRIFTKNTPNLITSFAQAARTGSGASGVGPEAGLEAAQLALSPKMLNGPNKGFLRKTAGLSLVMISDEADQSTQAVQFYINFFKGIKGGPKTDLVRVHAVIGYDTVRKLRNCKHSNSGGNQNNGASSAGRYKAVVDATKGALASICNTSWSHVLRQIGLLSFGQRKTYYLTRPADPKTLVVKVDGKLVAQGASTWSYDAASNAITFATVPNANANIHVTYKAICY